MNTRAIVLLSGGLDSMLAIRILQNQGVEVEALTFRTLFMCCQDQSALAARELGVRLSVLPVEDSYLDVIRSPHHGYGRGANPCVDCRVYMFRLAGRYMEEVGASLVASGEVLGQRPMSQKRRDLLLIAREAHLEDRLLRPLSAKLLPPTRPEVAGEIDRSRLYDFTGRSRKGLIALARQFGFPRIPQPSTGCALTEPAIATKVHDLVRLDPEGGRWDFELVRYGRHVRLDRQTKVVIGRREEENRSLEYMFARDDRPRATMLKPHNFNGPLTLLVGPENGPALDFACGLLLRYSKVSQSQQPLVCVTTGDTSRIVPAQASATALAAAPL